MSVSLSPIGRAHEQVDKLLAGTTLQDSVGAQDQLRARRCFGENLLGGRRMIVHVAEKSHQLPNLLIGYDVFPSGHSGPANAMLQEVEILVFWHVGHVIHELRRGGIERVGEGRFGLRGIALT